PTTGTGALGGGTSTFPKPGSMSGSSALGSPVAAKAIAVKDCVLFLGRADEFLCSTVASYNLCKPYVDEGRLKTCRRTGSLDVYSKRR
ncbi:MAG: hypothetical protein ABL931_24270, partial [Usitatibacteraceae bacterium]